MVPSSPPTPTSPASSKGATRIRIRVPRQPVSQVIVPSATGSKRHGQRMRSMSLSLSRTVTVDSDALGSDTRPPISPPSQTVVMVKRRQSSIAYYSSSSSPWSQQPQSNRALSSTLDGLKDEESAMTNGKENISHRSSLVLSPHSRSAGDSVGSSDGVGAREREPLTLVEKHADLLHFIAQKERKCLELRDQLAAHEKELAELKRKWERIINRGYDPQANLPITAGLGSVALDGLKEGVRIIAAGFSDFGGVVQELESDDKDASSKPKPLAHSPRENQYVCARRTGSQTLSTSSMSSIQESVSDDVIEREERERTATASSLSHTGSLSYRIHKRASRAFPSKEPTTAPPSACVTSPGNQSVESTNLDVGMSLVLSPSPTLVPLLSSALSTPTRPAPKLPTAQGSAPAPAPMTVGSMSSWMDSMGKRLSGLQNGSTFSKSQKRASSLLAGVSSTFASALSPGPTPTTPAPLPTLASMPTSHILSTTLPPSTSPVSQPSSKTTRAPQLLPPPYPEDHTDTAAATKWDWLDDEEQEQTVRGGTGDGGVLVPHGMPLPPLASSFEDDEWNW